MITRICLLCPEAIWGWVGGREKMGNLQPHDGASLCTETSERKGPGALESRGPLVPSPRRPAGWMGPAYSLSCLQGEVGRACQPQGGPRARGGLLEPGGGWCGDVLSAPLCPPVLSSLCSFNTLTHKPPEASPHYLLSLGLQEPNGWSLFTKTQPRGQLPRTLALKHPHQKSPSKDCPSAPGWDSQR